MSLIDLFKEFHREAIQQEFSPSSRVLFDTLLYEFNKAFWIDELAFSERDLIQMTGLKKTTLHEAKHFLTSKHFIKCTPFKKKTAYSLGEGFKKILATSNRPVTDQQATSNRPVGFVSYTRDAGEDNKTEDIKTNNNDDGAGANANEMDELLEYWEAQGGGRLTFEHQAEIAVWLSKKGLLWLKEAVKTAANANNNPRGMSFNFLKAIVSNRLNETSAPSKDESKPAATSVDDMLKALDEQIKW